MAARTKRVHVLFAVAIISGTAILASIVAPNFVRTRAQGGIRGCPGSLKNIATALEMYSTDNEGHYPRSLAQLTPKYLKMIPTCPSATSDTYNASWETARGPDAYTIFCNGNFHRATGILHPNYPQYSSFTGLIKP